jgi:PKD repeat protein
MSSHRTFTQSFIVLFILSLSFLMVGCGGDSDGTVETADGIADTIDSTVTIDASVTAGDAPLEVRFSVDSDDLVLSQSWNFGDGAIAKSINPNSSVEHTFIEDGTYTVSVVTSTNLGGSQSDAIEITVGSGIDQPVTKVFLLNLTTDLTLKNPVVGDNSVGDPGFNFQLISTVTGEPTSGLEPGEEGFIEVECDVSWQLDVSFTDANGEDARLVQIGMQLYPCGVDDGYTFFDL